MRTYFLLLFVCVFSFQLNAQRSDCSDFFTVLTYIRADKNLLNRFNKTFSKSMKRKMKCMNIHVSSEVVFIPIHNFSPSVYPYLPIDEKALESISSFKEEYDFSNYESYCLSRLLTNDKNQFVLYFSKPSDKFILAEILDSRLNIGSVKMGQALQILFVFDDDGKIANVYYADPYFN